MKLFKALSFVIAGIVLCALWSCREDGPAGQDNEMVEVSFRPEVDGVELDVVPFGGVTAPGEKIYW